MSLKRTMLLVLLLASQGFVCFSQTLTVGLPQTEGWLKENITMTCTFSIDDGTYAFNDLVWQQHGVKMVDFFGGLTEPVYFNGFTEEKYVVTRDSGSSVLKIIQPEKSDEGLYQCQVAFRKINTVIETATGDLDLNISPALGTLKIGGLGDGETMVVAASTTAPISCVLYGIKPGATVMSWSVSNSAVTFLSEEPYSMPNANDSELFDTNLTATFSFPASPLSMDLSCITPDRQVGPSTGNTTITITLNVTDPCQENPCENGGTCVNENGMPSCNCAGEFTGDTCSEKVPTTPPPEPTQPTGTDGKPTEVPTTPPEPTQPTGTDGKPTEATDQPLSVAAIAGISCGCVLAGLCLIGIGIYLCYTYDCCIWCGEHCPWCREHCSCCRKPPKDGGNRDENIGMNNTGDSEEDHPTEKDQDHITKKDLT